MDEGDHEGSTAGRSQALTVAAIAVLAIVLALLAGAAAGPWEWPDPGSGSTPIGSGEPPPTLFPTFPSQEAPPDLSEAEPGGENPFVRWLIIATVAAIGVLVILLLVRLGLMLRRGTVPPPDPRQVSTPHAEELIDAPAIQEGIAAAREALTSDRPPRDAIVRAWLALETAAGDAGVVRRPSQTPTEFASLVLTRTSADDTAVEILRRLYTRSRFSEAEVTRDDAERARAALERIALSWSALEVRP
ncbi:DUF4129 domain-containing protein [Pseudactinotalea suaedae]|uniref:DUF4129 domain-containing protein n=1 Tax=Pseudactinotalea suaedae TaxID=1524924 RepID=UPI001390911F|nr:DUF4129 domain-containing protein [Pseudactinotalea suaedae]